MGSCNICHKPLLGYTKTDDGLDNQRKAKAKCGNPTFLGANKHAAANPHSKEDRVIATKCGHLFHNQCLLHYMSTFKGVTSQTFAECPTCQQKIGLSSSIVINFNGNKGRTDITEKDLKNEEARNRELERQLETVQKKLVEKIGAINDGFQLCTRLQAEEYSIKEQLNPEKSLANEAKELHDAITAMEDENITLAKAYLDMLINWSDDKLKALEPIPVELCPHLSTIRDYRSLLKRILQIVAPIPFTGDRFGKLGRNPPKAVLVNDILNRVSTMNQELEDSEPEPKSSSESDFLTDDAYFGVYNYSDSCVESERSSTGIWNLSEKISPIKKSQAPAKAALSLGRANAYPALTEASERKSVPGEIVLDSEISTEGVHCKQLPKTKEIPSSTTALQIEGPIQFSISTRSFLSHELLPKQTRNPVSSLDLPQRNCRESKLPAHGNLNTPIFLEMPIHTTKDVQDISDSKMSTPSILCSMPPSPKSVPASIFVESLAEECQFPASTMCPIVKISPPNKLAPIVTPPVSLPIQTAAIAIPVPAEPSIVESVLQYIPAPPPILPAVTLPKQDSTDSIRIPTAIGLLEPSLESAPNPTPIPSFESASVKDDELFLPKAPAPGPIFSPAAIPEPEFTSRDTSSALDNTSVAPGKFFPVERITNELCLPAELNFTAQSQLPISTKSHHEKLNTYISDPGDLNTVKAESPSGNSRISTPTLNISSAAPESNVSGLNILPSRMDLASILPLKSSGHMMPISEISTAGTGFLEQSTLIPDQLAQFPHCDIPPPLEITFDGQLKAMCDINPTAIRAQEQNGNPLSPKFAIEPILPPPQEQIGDTQISVPCPAQFLAQISSEPEISPVIRQNPKTTFPGYPPSVDSPHRLGGNIMWPSTPHEPYILHGHQHREFENCSVYDSGEYCSGCNGLSSFEFEAVKSPNHPPWAHPPPFGFYRPQEPQRHLHYHLHSRELDAMTVSPPLPTTPTAFPAPPPGFQNTENSSSLSQELALVNLDSIDSSDFSILDWLPEPPENKQGPFQAHGEIDPAVALMIASRQTNHLKQLDNHRPILKARKTREFKRF